MAIRLPLFPLSVVLFPGAILPLHIFEPRYRRMLADCLEGDGRFGILPVSPGGTVPPAGTIGCVAEIAQVQPLPDGRSNIITRGGERVRLVAVVDAGTPYYMGEVEPVLDDAESDPGTDQLAALRALHARYAELLQRVTDREAEVGELPDDPVEASFVAAGLVECELPRKQRMLATRSTAERVGLLLQVYPPLIAALEDAVTVHERARTNGKGHHHPDIDGP